MVQIEGTGVVSRAVVKVADETQEETDKLSFDTGSISSAEGNQLEFSQSDSEITFDAGLSQGDPAIFQKAFRAISYQNEVSVHWNSLFRPTLSSHLAGYYGTHVSHGSTGTKRQRGARPMCARDSWFP
jgi:hypothetical protein